MSKTPRRPAQLPATGLSRPVVATGIATTVLIAAGAFTLSFAALTDLAKLSGISPVLAWIWPVIIDGLIIASTVSIVALAGHPRRTMAYPWALLFGGAAVSTAANAVHAVLATAGGSNVPPWVAAIVASMPPVVLLAVTHLSVILVQKSGVKPVAVKKVATKPAVKSAVAREKAVEPVATVVAPVVTVEPVAVPVAAAVPVVATTPVAPAVPAVPTTEPVATFEALAAKSPRKAPARRATAKKVTAETEPAVQPLLPPFAAVVEVADDVKVEPERVEAMAA